MTADVGFPTQIFDGVSFLPRVSKYDGRAIEAAMAGQSLFDQPLSLHGAVIEATVVASGPPLLGRLEEGHVARLIDHIDRWLGALSRAATTPARVGKRHAKRDSSDDRVRHAP